MPHFLAILIIFVTMPGGKPEVHMSGYQAESLEDCQAKIGPTISSISQMPGVTYVKGACLVVVDPEEKAA